MATALESPISVLGEQVATSFLPLTISSGGEIFGTAVGGVDWCEFYLRPDSVDTSLLVETNQAMTAFYDTNQLPSLKDLNIAVKGIPCAVRYTKDKKWYRARLDDAAYNLVRFVDYGNVQMCSESDIKPLIRMYTDIIPPASIRCTLTTVQDVNLPSFKDNCNVKITVLGVTEPYEVAVQVLTPSATSGGISSKRMDPITGASTSKVRRTDSPGPSNPISLTTLPRQNGHMFEDDDLDKAKTNGHVTRPTYRYPATSVSAGPTQQSRYNIQNAVGIISDLYATCGHVYLVSRPASRAELNVQQSSFASGPLMVDDLRRLFRVGERVRYNAKYEQPYITQEMEWIRMVAEDNDPEYKKRKPNDPMPNGDISRWLVTDFRLANNDQLTVTHAVVNFVSDSAASLYVRQTGDTIWALKGIFPADIAGSARPLRDLVDIGRSVIVRAVPSDALADCKVSAGWVGQAVELIGSTYEEKGTMYLVRDNYSVIITDGTSGFGYAYVANQFVDPAGVPMEEWYGTQVYFRSCADIPDDENTNVRVHGTRMKALRAHLSPEETKGAYRYPGIYRPPPCVVSESSFPSGEKSIVKKLLNGEDDWWDLSGDAVREMDVLGRDTIGIEGNVVTFETPEPIEMVRENLQNEIRSEMMVQQGGQSGTMNGQSDTMNGQSGKMNGQLETTPHQNGAGDPPVRVDLMSMNDPVLETAMANAMATLRESKGANMVKNNEAELRKNLEEDMELMSTVEIEFDSSFEPLSLIPPLTPIQQAQSPKPVNDIKQVSEGPPSSIDGSTLSKDGNALNEVGNTTKNEEGGKLLKVALVDLRAAMDAEEHMTLLMQFTLKLREEERRRFYKLWRQTTMP